MYKQIKLQKINKKCKREREKICIVKKINIMFVFIYF